MVGEPTLIAGVVDETLRYDTSVPMWRRVTKQSVTLGGVELSEGAKLLLWLAAASRDPAAFPEPETFGGPVHERVEDSGIRQGNSLLPRCGAGQIENALAR